MTDGLQGTASEELVPGMADEAAVATWQWRLVQTLGRDLDVDEHVGPATAQATRDFQRAQRLAVDGGVGRRTRAAMVRVLEL